jgi:hypothetical protein
MRRSRNPRYAPEFLERKLNPSVNFTGVVAAQVSAPPAPNAVDQTVIVAPAFVASPAAALGDDPPSDPPADPPSVPSSPADDPGLPPLPGPDEPPALTSGFSGSGSGSGALGNDGAAGGGSGLTGGIYISSGALELPGAN